MHEACLLCGWRYSEPWLRGAWRADLQLLAGWHQHTSQVGTVRYLPPPRFVTYTMRHPGSCHSVGRAGLPSLLDFGDVGAFSVLCTFSNISAAGIVRTSQLSSPLPGRAVRNFDIMTGGGACPSCYKSLPLHPSPFLQLGRAGRRVGSVPCGFTSHLHTRYGSMLETDAGSERSSFQIRPLSWPSKKWVLKGVQYILQMYVITYQWHILLNPDPTSSGSATLWTCHGPMGLNRMAYPSADPNIDHKMVQKMASS